MPTEAEMMKDLQAADSAGDTQLATHIAGLIKAGRSASPPTTYDPTEGMSQTNKVMAGIGGGAQDAWLGVKGFAARHLGMGDPNEVAAQVAEKQKLDAPLLATGAGQAGKTIADIAPWLVPGGGVIKGAAMLPKGLKLLGNLAGSAGLGAASDVLSPSADPNVSDTTRAESGAMYGAAGAGVGEAFGKLIRPLKDIVSPYAQQGVDALKNSAMADKLKLVATNLSDNSSIKSASDALSKVPWFGRGVNAAREQNLAALTEQETKATGTTMSTLLPKDMTKMWDRLDTAGDKFRSGPDVSMATVATDARAAADKVREYAALTSQPGGTAKLDRAAEILATPPSVINPTTGAPFPAPPKTMTADEVMNLRRAASELAYKTDDPVLAAQYRAYRDSLDSALKATHPDTGQAFDTWRKEWGAAEEVRKAADAGLSDQGHMLPQNIEKNLSDRARGGAPSTDREKMVVAANSRFQRVPGNENRALLTALMFGAPLAGGALNKYTDSPITGTATAAAPFIASALLGTKGGGRYLTGTIPGQAGLSEYARLMAQQLGINQ